MVARRFELPVDHHWRTVGALVLATLIISPAGAYFLSADSAEYSFWTYAAWIALIGPGGPLLLSLFAAFQEMRTPSPQCVVVGIDGVLIDKRFIPYSDIRSVKHERHSYEVTVPTQGGNIEETRHVWKVLISHGRTSGEGVLLAAETIEIATSPFESEDQLGAEIRDAIHEIWSVGVPEEPNEDVESAILREQRTGSEWVEALRSLGSGVSAHYRGAALDIERLSRLLDDPRRLPSLRAAAAVVIAASGDKTAATRLRGVADALVEPRVRIALHEIADETAVADALDALEKLEGERKREHH